MIDWKPQEEKDSLGWKEYSCGVAFVVVFFGSILLIEWLGA